jgi:hypothetical protein
MIIGGDYRFSERQTLLCNFSRPSGALPGRGQQGVLPVKLATKNLLTGTAAKRTMTRIALGLGLTLTAGAFALGRASVQNETFTMPAWTQPTAEHKELAKSVGNWDVKGEFSMPGQPPQQITGTAKRELILNGMFLKETFHSEFAGMPFEGQLLQGYDTIRKEWVSIWMDSGSPVISVSQGKKEGDALVFFGEDPDFMTGKLKKTKTVVKVPDADHVTVSIYDVLEGSESLHMQMDYTRKK